LIRRWCGRCIVKTATYNPFRMNRELLNLLTSHADAPPSIAQAVEEMHEAELRRLGAMLLEPSAARGVLAKVLGEGEVTDLQRSGLDVLADRYLLALLRHVYSFRVCLLRRKTGIPVCRSLGCLLMAIPDPFHVLKPNQVFFNVRSFDPATGTEGGYAPRVCDRVLMFRNPCLHPGDLRVVEAVDCEQLRMYTNVLILPSHPDCPSSLGASTPNRIGLYKRVAWAVAPTPSSLLILFSPERSALVCLCPRSVGV
jgi:hypothetical protein